MTNNPILLFLRIGDKNTLKVNPKKIMTCQNLYNKRRLKAIVDKGKQENNGRDVGITVPKNCSSLKKTAAHFPF